LLELAAPATWLPRKLSGQHRLPLFRLADKCGSEQQFWHMQLGMIGLGRMGANMARRLMQDGHHVVVYDRITLAPGEGTVGPASGQEKIRSTAEKGYLPLWAGRCGLFRQR
jgi:hypothetical protein